MLTFITTPTDLIGQISPVATGLIGDFAPYAALIIGIAIGLWIVGWLIDKIRGTSSSQALSSEQDDYGYWGSKEKLQREIRRREELPASSPFHIGRLDDDDDIF